jgi:hypothetical protein
MGDWQKGWKDISLKAPSGELFEDKSNVKEYDG